MFEENQLRKLLFTVVAVAVELLLPVAAAFPVADAAANSGDVGREVDVIADVVILALLATIVSSLLTRPTLPLAALPNEDASRPHIFSKYLVFPNRVDNFSADVRSIVHTGANVLFNVPVLALWANFDINLEFCSSMLDFSRKNSESSLLATKPYFIL
uniref:Uncharacterized protein n=1 Tax=Glossina austeni TaxID=7395 RepID=A0A1A9VPH3_GLOAU